MKTFREYAAARDINFHQGPSHGGRQNKIMPVDMDAMPMQKIHQMLKNGDTPILLDNNTKEKFEVFTFNNDVVGIHVLKTGAKMGYPRKDFEANMEKGVFTFLNT